MVRGILMASAIALLLVLAVSTSRSQTADGEPEGMPTTEPIAEPGADSTRWTPRKPYMSPPPADAWTGDQLPGADRALIERLRATEAQRAQTAAVYAAAGQEAFEEGMAQIAQHRLGLLEMAEIGVVPEGDPASGDEGGAE